MRPSRPIAYLPVVLVLCAGTLVGCSDATATKDASGTDTASSSGPSASSGKSSSASPTSGPSASSTSPGQQDSGRPSKRPSASPSEQPSVRSTGEPFLPRSRIEAAALHTTVLDRNAAASNEEQEVVDAWMDYWKAATDTLYFVRPSAQLRSVARGQALTSVLSYVEMLKTRKQRVVGWAKDNVTSVKVTGDEADVRDCTKNFTFSVDEEGEPATRPIPYYDVTGTLARDGSRWVVTEAHLKELTKSCMS